MSAVEKFPVLLSEAEEESSAVPPCFSDEGINVRCAAGVPSKAKNTRLIFSVSLHKTQQSLPPRHYQTQHQRRRDPSFPA